MGGRDFFQQFLFSISSNPATFRHPPLLSSLCYLPPALFRSLVIIPLLNQDENAKASEQRRNSTLEYGEEPHSGADNVNA